MMGNLYLDVRAYTFLSYPGTRREVDPRVPGWMGSNGAVENHHGRHNSAFWSGLLTFLGLAERKSQPSNPDWQIMPLG